MSKLAPALILGATLAVMSLAAALVLAGQSLAAVMATRPGPNPTQV
jgi:hypothetical protein